MAKQFWPKSDPLNDRLVIGRGVMREFATEAASGRSSASSATSRATGSNSDPQPQMFIPQAQVPDAANALNVSLTPIAWVVRTQVAAAVGEQRRSRSSCARRPACRSPTSRSMDEVVSLSTSRAALQHVADVGLRRAARCCSRRSASTA